MRIIFYYAFLFACLFIALVLSPIVYRQGKLFFSQTDFLLGFLIFIFVYWILLKPRIKIFRTLDHELSHALIALCFGHKIVELKVTDRMGGHILHKGNNHNFLITLAPYVLRIPTIATVLIIYLLANQHHQKYYLMAFGTALAYHAVCLFEEARPHQSDIRKLGFLSAYLWIVALNILWFGVLFTIVQSHYGLTDFFAEGYQNILYFINSVYHYVQR